MNVEVHLFNVFLEERTHQTVQIPDDAPLAELVEELGLYRCNTNVDLGKYYCIPDASFLLPNSTNLPYVIIDQRVKWDVPLEEASVRDFFLTHDVRDYRLYLKSGYPMAGGPGLEDIALQWERVYGLLEYVATISGAGVAVGWLLLRLKPCVNWVTRRRQGKDRVYEALRNVPPATAFSFVCSRKYWNHNDLAEMIRVLPDEAKLLLKLCRFRWDRERMVYAQTKATQEVVRVLTQRNSEYTFPSR